jgi:hypothetical protein
MVGGILDNAGVTGFLGSLVEWRSETDFETKFWSDHFQWLLDGFGAGAEFTVPEVVKKMKHTGHVEHPPRLEDHTATGYNRSLGLAYSKVKTRIINGLQLVKTAEFAGHSNRWTVVDHRVQGETMPTFVAPEGKFQRGPSKITEARVVRVDGNTQDTEDFNLRDAMCIDESESASGSTVRNYPTYPNYPATEGADPLTLLLPLCIEVPARICPDCDQPEELTPSGFYFACRTCTPGTFAPRT